MLEVAATVASTCMEKTMALDVDDVQQLADR